MDFTLIWNKVLYSGMNYRIKGFESVNGGHGGDINAHWEKLNPSLGLDSCIGLGHS